MTSTLTCAIPTCRTPGEHRPLCDGDCRYGCQPRLAEEGYACSSCIGHLHQLLGVIAGLTPDARAVAAGQARPGATHNGGSTNKPGSQSPGNDDATDTLDEITNALAKIARDIAHTRGPQSLPTLRAALALPEPLGGLCSWLSGALKWVRHALDDQGQPYAVTVHAVIRENASKIRGIVNGPGARRYLGPCGAPVQVETTTFSSPEPTYTEVSCDGDVYGRPGALTGTCRTCGAQVRQDERQVWINDITRGRAYRASEIEHAHGVRAHTIRMWADRNLIAIHDHDQHGRQLYLLGDVLNQAARMATRRAELEAKRAARTGA